MGVTQQTCALVGADMAQLCSVWQACVCVCVLCVRVHTIGACKSVCCVACVVCACAYWCVPARDCVLCSCVVCCVLCVCTLVRACKRRSAAGR